MNLFREFDPKTLENWPKWEQDELEPTEEIKVVEMKQQLHISVCSFPTHTPVSSLMSVT